MVRFEVLCVLGFVAYLPTAIASQFEPEAVKRDGVAFDDGFANLAPGATYSAQNYTADNHGLGARSLGLFGLEKRQSCSAGYYKCTNSAGCCQNGYE